MSQSTFYINFNKLFELEELRKMTNRIHKLKFSNIKKILFKLESDQTRSSI